MPLLKGTAWTVNFEFIKQRFGDEALEKVFAQLSAGDQGKVPGTIVDKFIERRGSSCLGQAVISKEKLQIIEAAG